MEFEVVLYDFTKPGHVSIYHVLSRTFVSNGAFR